jgi:quercetin dioxygenase-like cupin family protein
LKDLLRRGNYDWPAVSGFDDVARIEPQQIWDGILARSVHGERITMAVVELDPDSVVPEHSHENEQLGICLRGSLRFRIGDETRELGPGGTWRIPSNTPHEVVSGPEGAVVIDLFAPIRADWEQFEHQKPRQARWPS